MYFLLCLECLTILMLILCPLSNPPPPLCTYVVILLPRPGEPFLWAGPQFLALSLLSHCSPVLPCCWLRTLAAHGQPEHSHLPEVKLRHWTGGQLRRPLPDTPVLSLSGFTIQQVWACHPTREHPGTITFHRQHSEGSQVGGSFFVAFPQQILWRRWLTLVSQRNVNCTNTFIYFFPFFLNPIAKSFFFPFVLHSSSFSKCHSWVSHCGTNIHRVCGFLIE